MFESQTKIKLGSLQMAPGGESINKYVGDFIKREIDNFLHIHPDVAEVMKQKIEESEKERKAMAGVTKLARERSKTASLVWLLHLKNEKYGYEEQEFEL